MKISIDTDNKVIELSEKANIKELWDMVEKMFGDDAQNWDVELQRVNIPSGPIPRTPEVNRQTRPVVMEKTPSFETLESQGKTLEDEFAKMYGKTNPVLGGNPLSFEQS